MDYKAPNNQTMKISKTEAEYNMKSIRFLLLTITSMFLVISALMIVLGISVYSHYHNFTFFYTTAKTGHFITPSVLCVFLGLVLLLVSLFGFFGSLKQSTCMVNSYALLLGLVLVVKLVVVILALTLKEDVVRDYIHIPVTDYTVDPEIQFEIDTLQSKLGCCGFYSYLDYTDAQFTSNHSTVVVTKENQEGNQVTIVLPASCCVSPGEVFCSRMWSTSCQAALIEVLVQNSTVLGVLGVSVMFINLLGIIFALLLARCIRKQKSEKALMQWKIREQFIMAREAQAQDEKGHVVIEKQASSTA